MKFTSRVYPFKRAVLETHVFQNSSPALRLPVAHHSAQKTVLWEAESVLVLSFFRPSNNAPIDECVLWQVFDAFAHCSICKQLFLGRTSNWQVLYSYQWHRFGKESVLEQVMGVAACFWCWSLSYGFFWRSKKETFTFFLSHYAAERNWMYFTEQLAKKLLSNCKCFVDHVSMFVLKNILCWVNMQYFYAPKVAYCYSMWLRKKSLLDQIHFILQS